LAKLGAFIQVSDIRGKIGGNVFSKSRSGHTLRVRVKPRNPRSSSQTSVRALVTAGSRVAKAMGSSDVLDWKAYASSITKHNSVSGAAYSPSWITALVELYVPFFLATPGGTFPTSPPTDPYTGDVITITAAGGSEQIVMTGSAQSTSDQTVFLYAELLKSVNRAGSNRPGKLISVAPIPATPFEVTVTGLAVGEYKLSYRFVDTATGQQGPLVALPNVAVS
jgi:hypothetical protein